MSNSITKKHFEIYLNWQRVINPIKYSKKEFKNKNAMQEWRAWGGGGDICREINDINQW